MRKNFLCIYEIFWKFRKTGQLNALKINEVKETNDKNLHRISNKNVVHNIIWDH